MISRNNDVITQTELRDANGDNFRRNLPSQINLYPTPPLLLVVCFSAMVYQDPIAEFISALQEISELHCGTALSPEICLIILFRYGGMQHPFNVVMQDTEFQYTLRSLEYPGAFDCVCGYRAPLITTESSSLWLKDHDTWHPTRITACHSFRSTHYDYCQLKHYNWTGRNHSQIWLNNNRCGMAWLWYNYKLNRDDSPRWPPPAMTSREFSLVYYLKNATIERLEEDVVMFVGDPLLDNATPEEWKWLTSPHERGTRNTGRTEPTEEERRELIRKFLREAEPLPEVPDVSGLLSRIKTRSE